LIRDIKNLRLSFLLPLGILSAGWGFLNDTYQYPLKREEGDIRILSYNIRVFNIYDPGAVSNMMPLRMTDWIRNSGSDIICLQEFYSDPNSPSVNTINLINRENDYHVYNLPVFTNRIGAQFGIVIFSRFPIIRTGEIRFERNTQNQAIYADVMINADTVRIYNLHLQSMHINDTHMMMDNSHLQEDVMNLYNRLKFGFVQRSLQVRDVKNNIEKCPYRVIVCGDLNDLPYSYSYHQLKNILKNSFTSAGKGFGFTYNGRLAFLRIDNQFYSEGIKAQSLKTDRDVRFSDHFPVIGTYSVVGR
jgi:endonuclease/exonuclease/phosphatase family metal-dependent hydrolase